MEICPCGAGLLYAACCEPVIRGQRPAETAEQLMRSRYSAYVKAEIPYLGTTLHPEHRKDFDEKSTRAWAESSEWQGLSIVKTEGGGVDDSEGVVEFVASYVQDGKKIDHHELSHFSKKDGIWYFVNGEGVAPKTVVRSAPKVGRNDPCPCGSGKKFKKCCGS